MFAMETKPAAGANPNPGDLLDTFRAEHPELGDAIDQAERTTEIVDAYDQSREPVLRYTVNVGTTTT